jgi:uncharacterized coiled-coil protein SlyX
MISGQWIIAVIVALVASLGSAGAAWIAAMKKGEAKGRSEKITLQSPVPEVPVRRIYSPPTFSQHMELSRRLESLEERTAKSEDELQAAVAQIRAEMGKQYVEILKAGHEREIRLSDKLDDIARAFHSRVDDLIKTPVKK